MILVGILTSLFIYFGDGPFWAYTDPTGLNPSLYDACKDHWWTNLLYVNNIVYPVNQVVHLYTISLYSLWLQNCAEGVRLFWRPMSEVLWWCVHSCTHRCCMFETTISGPRRPRRSADHGDLVVSCVQSTRFGSRSFRVCGPTVCNKLPQDLWSTDTGNSLSIALSDGCLSVHMAGGVSDNIR